MYNNSKNMHNDSKNTKTTKTKKKKVFFNDVMMTSSHHLHQNTTWFIFGEEKKNSAKILCIFWQKHLGFHPQTSILQSKPKNCTKKRIKWRTKISPNFRNSIKWAPKTIKTRWVLLQTIFSTNLQHQSGLKTEKQHQTKKKKTPKKNWLP